MSVRNVNGNVFHLAVCSWAEPALAQSLPISVWESLVPIFATIVGALVALFGVALQHYYSRKLEHRRVAREKLEQLYLASGEVEDYVLGLFRLITQLQVSPSAASDLDASEDSSSLTLVMLARLYEPSLAPLAEQFREHAEQMRSNVVRAGMTMVSRGKTLSEEEYREAVRPLEETKHAALLLRRQIERLSQKYR